MKCYDHVCQLMKVSTSILFFERFYLNLHTNYETLHHKTLQNFLQNIHTIINCLVCHNVPQV